MLAHLDHCAACLEASADWAATADVLPLLLSDAEPPAGFEARTLERLRAGQVLVPRPSTMRRVLAVAAIAAAVMIATLAAVRIVDGRTTDSSSSSGSSTNVASAPMIGPKGHDAGHAFMTTGEDRYVFLEVNYGARSGMYSIEAVDDANRVTALGPLPIDQGHGVWAGEMPGGTAGEPPTMVRVIGPDGRILCTARFDPVAT